MANVDRARGFVPVRHLSGAAWNGQVQVFLVDSGDGTALYVGDPVKIAGSAGVLGQVVAGLDVEGIATITRCASGTAEQLMLGIVIGFSPDPTDLTKVHRAASTSRIAYVITDPTVVYEIQEDAVTSNLAAADVGLNISFSTTAGSSTTGQSGIQVISNAKATTNTLPCKIVGLSKRVDNSFGLSTSDKAKVHVLLNTGAYAPNVAGG